MGSEFEGSKRLDCSITEPLNLGKLRWLVAQCEGLPDTSRVTVKEHRGMSPMDWDAASIGSTGQRPKCP